MAQMGMYYPGLTGYGGASLGAIPGGYATGGGGYYGGYTPGMLSGGGYYPPYSSGSGGGLSISGGFNLSR